MTTGPKKVENRGGYRPGAGRKPEMTLSAMQIREMHKAAKKKAKEEGKTVDEVLLEHVYCDNRRESIAAIKIWKEYTTPKIHEGGETDKTAGPAIYLPEQDKGPDLKVVDK